MKIKIIKELFDLDIPDEKLKQLDIVLDFYMSINDMEDRLKELDIDDTKKTKLKKTLKELLDLIKELK